MFFKKKTQQEEHQDVVISDRIDYSRCELTKMQNLMVFMLATIAGTMLFYIFYKNIIVGLILARIAAPMVVNIISENKIAKRRTVLRSQFKDLLESMTISLKAGNNEIGALQSARGELVMLHSEESDIVKELDYIVRGYHNNILLKDLFKDLGERSGVEDIKDFAKVFEVIEGKSNKVSEVIRKTQQIITDKMEVEMEIETIVTGSKSEINMMLLIPIIIVAMMGFMGDGFMDATQGSIKGVMISTITIAIFIAAYLYARYITKIDV